jgi:hypothetical protein
MTTRDQALEALSRNAAIDWLFGRVLRSLASRDQWHFLFEVLAGKNPHALEQWNAWIEEFRSVVKNPDVAAEKACEELSASPPDRIGDFMAEVFAVITLSRDGYTDFQAVLAQGDKPVVDFTALKEGRRVRVEVKHLHEPRDIIRTVATERWKLRCREEAARFNFALGVSHHYYGVLSDAAIARLKMAIDQLPDIASNEYRVTLETGVEVVLTRTVGKQGLAVHSRIGSRDFEFDLPELQNLFVKAFRDVSASLLKFFGRQTDPDAINVIAMQWEPTKVMYDPKTAERVKVAIEQAFAAVGLQLRILMFAYPPPHDLRFRSKV